MQQQTNKTKGKIKEMKVFSIYDSKAEAYMQPFFSQNKGTAIRSFADAAQQEEGQFAKHSADYTLFEVGEWDEDTGTMMPAKANINLGTALEHISTRPDNVTGIRPPITDGRKETA